MSENKSIDQSLSSDSVGSHLKSTSSNVRKSKTISVSSTESMSSEIICISEKSSNNDRQLVLLQQSQHSIQTMKANDDVYEIETNLFDFSKTGAIPKQKTKYQPNSRSSLSSSTSSSLSSLISSVPFTKKKQPSSSNSSGNYNSELNYWQLQDKQDENDFQIGFRVSEQNSKLNIHHTLDQDEETPNEFKEQVTCPLCLKIVFTPLESHFEAKHKEVECPYCDLLFDNGLVLSQHVDSVHSIQSDEATLKKDYECWFDYSKQPNYSASGANNLDHTDLKSVSDTVNEHKCPVCMVIVNEGVEFLQAHVEAHFSSPTSFSDLISSKSRKSRTHSASSLIANVDENFELDQVMTLEDSDCEMNHKEPYLNIHTYQNDQNSDLQKDYELALLLEQQENNRSENSDFLLAQMYERQQAESIKYLLLQENSGTNQINEENLSTETFSDELEHEWLKQKYGMTEMKASTKAQSNLDQLLKQNRIDMITYSYEKDHIESRLNSLVDDGSTCSKDIIQMIESSPLNKTIARRIVCTKCDHYSSGFIDRGYGCGYRNTQMILSAIREDPSLKDALFNNNNRSMPSITKIQQLIENAWSNGFDLLGKQSLGGSIKNTAKWIGASDVCAMFSSLRIKTELIDIQLDSNSSSSIGKILFKFVKNHFEEEIKSGKQFIHPIYFQHDGHSRLIIGIEIGKNDHSQNLLLFDPSTTKYQVEQFKKNASKFFHLFRRGMASFNKNKEYQLLLIKGLIDSNEEFERAKLLTSKKVTN